MADPRPVAPPAETFDVGSLRVQRHGERGRPVVLVPGLAGGAPSTRGWAPGWVFAA